MYRYALREPRAPPPRLRGEQEVDEEEHARQRPHITTLLADQRPGLEPSFTLLATS